MKLLLIAVLSGAVVLALLIVAVRLADTTHSEPAPTTKASVATTKEKHLPWPPQACAGQKPEASTFKTILGAYNGVVYKSSDKKPDEKLGFGQTIVDGQMALSSNPFLVKKVPEAYVENSYEIVFYDQSSSVIRLDPKRQDKLTIMQWEKDPNRSDNFRQAEGTLTVVYPGGKVRCKDQVYEIRTDGWYVNGEMIHRFAEQ